VPIRYLGRIVPATLVVALSSVARAAPVVSETPVTLDAGGGVQLSGTLATPSGRSPFPVALIIAGSGPTDRDGNNPQAKTDAYKLLAAALAARGIATLRYDKRGIGASRTRQHESDLRFDDFVADAVALTHYLESTKQFSSVSIVGHSEGSLIGILAAQRDPNVRALVSIAGAGRRAPEVLEEQFRAGGIAPAMASEVAQYDRSLLAGQAVPSPDPELLMLFRPSVQPYLISWYKYDPAAEIAKVTIPVLIVQGTTDLHVNVTDANRLAEADPHAKLAIIQGMNHVLRVAPPDRAQNIETYNDPTLPLDPQAVSTIADFLLAP
jgi:pimeloyl-ACP methyl ester carboxylesterase